MADNVLIPLPGFALPADFPWQVGFVAQVDDQLRRLRTTGHFVPPRFFGYYFQAHVPIGVAGSWTVSLDSIQPVSLLPGLLDRVTHGQFSLTSVSREVTPDFMLIHDRRDGACWLWSFEAGLQFVEAAEPVVDSDGGWDDVEKPRLLGP